MIRAVLEGALSGAVAVIFMWSLVILVLLTLKACMGS